MGTDGSGIGGLLSLYVAAEGAGTGFRLYRYRSTRVVQPGGKDPARGTQLLLIFGIPLMLVGGIVGNVWAINLHGVNAVIPAIFFDLIALFVLVWLSIRLWIAMEARRRRTRYVIAEISYPDAPGDVTSAMRRIHKSSRTLRKGRAHAEGMFGDLELDRLVYEAAEQAVISSELSAAARKLKAAQTGEDREALAAASARLAEASRFLREVETSLARAAGTAKQLSADITRPEKERAAQAAKEQRREQARAELDRATIRAELRPTTNGGSDIEERVNAVRAGYDEATGAAEAVLSGHPDVVNQPDLATNEDPAADSRHAAREAVWKATKFSAGKAAKFSITTAKIATEKIRSEAAKRRDESESQDQ